MADWQEAKDSLEGLGKKWLVNITDLFSTLLDKKSEVAGIEFSMQTAEEFGAKVAGSPWILVNFTMEPFSECFLLFQKRDAAVMVDLIIGGDGRVPSLDFSELHLSILEESASQIIKSFTTALSAEMGSTFVSEIKQTVESDFSQMSFTRVAQMRFTFTVEDLIEGEFSFLLDGDVVENYFKTGAAEEPAPEPEKPAPKAEAPAPARAAAPAARAKKPPPRSVEEQLEAEEAAEEEYEEAPVRRRRRPRPAPRPVAPRRPKIIEEEYDEEYAEEEEYDEEEPTYQRLALQPVSRRSPSSRFPGLDFLMDINVKVTAVLGKTEIFLRDLLEMGVGSVIQLDKFESEPVELMVNNKLVARGEIVVVDEKFGVKITETISDLERVLRG